MARSIIVLIAVSLSVTLRVCGQNWVIDIQVSINHADCALESMLTANTSFNGVNAVGSVSSGYTISGSGAASGVFAVSASGVCIQSLNQSNPVVGSFSDSYSANYTFGNCYEEVYYSSPYSSVDLVNVAGVIRFYPQLAVTVTNDCLYPTLTSTICAGNIPYKWEVSNAPNGTYYAFGGTTSSITASADLLHRPEFGSSKYQTRWVRVTGRAGTTSPAVQVPLYPPAYAIISASGNAPSCPGGQGSLTIVHGNDTPIGTTVTYTITQYIQAIYGACQNQSNSLTLESNQGTFPSGLSTSAKTYCAGWVGSISRTISSINDLSQTLTTSNGPSELLLYPGIYQVKIETGNSSCDKRYYIEIPPAPDNLNVSKDIAQFSPTSCTGGNDGSAGFVITGGVAPYTWQLFNNSIQILANAVPSSNSQVVISGLTASNSYYVKVFDSCPNKNDTSQFKIGNGPLFSTSEVHDNVTCVTTLNSNGVIKATVAPIAGLSYSYYLYSGTALIDSDESVASTSSTFSNVPPGSYTLTVRTNSQCESNIYNINLTGPTTLSGNQSSGEISCSNGSDGSITLTNISKAFGNINYSYTLTKSDGNFVPLSESNITSASDKLISSNLPEGVYEVSIVDNCNADAAFQLTNIAITKPIELTIDQVDDKMIDCADGFLPSLVLAFNHGTAPFTVDLKKNAISLATFPKVYQTSTSLIETNLGTGVYTLTVKDKCDVVKNMSFTISSAGSPINATIQKPLLPNGYNLACAESTNGTLQITVDGGVQGPGPKYRIDLLDNSGKTITSNLAPGSGSEAIEEVVQGANLAYTISGLRAAIAYQIRVTDFNSTPGPCSKIFDNINGSPLTLSAPPPLQIAPPDFANHFANEVVYNGELYVQCKGDLLSYVAPVTGGNAPYTVNLNTSESKTWPGSHFLDAANVSDGTAEFSDLTAGYYEVRVNDQLGCAYTPRYFEIKQASAPVQVTGISSPTFAHGANTSCYGYSDASVTVAGVGGIGPYTFTLTDNNSNLPLTISNSPSSIYTFNGLPAINSSGLAIAYTIAFQDVLGCPWYPLNSGASMIELTTPQPVSFTKQIISHTEGLYEIPCMGDEAELSAYSAGGLFPHVITISNTSHSLNISDLVSNLSDESLFQLPSGSYSASVVDALGCIAQEQTFILDEPSTHVQLSVNSVTPPICIGGYDGTIIVSAVGGITSPGGPDYIFSIKADGYSQYDADSVAGAAGTFIRPAKGFASQTYSLRVRDKHQCFDDLEVTMPANPSPLALTPNDLSSPTCYGASNGSIQVTASNYDLINGSVLRFMISGGSLGNNILSIEHPGATFTFEGLEGTDIGSNIPYQIWVEDAHMCVDTAHQYLGHLVLPSVEKIQIVSPENPTRPSCFNGSDGSLNLKISGGILPYFYSNDNVSYVQLPSTTVVVPALGAGDYSIYIRDSNYDPLQSACQASQTFTIPPGRIISLRTEVTSVSCKDGSDGAINLTADVNNRKYDEPFEIDRLSLSWSHDNLSTSSISSLEDLTDLSKGTYTVRASYDLDSVVCLNKKTVTVLEPLNPFAISNITLYKASCGLSNDGKAVVNVSGGWPSSVNYYRVDSGSWKIFTTPNFLLTNLSPGKHFLEISQFNFACTVAQEFTIDRSTLPIQIFSKAMPSCPLRADGSIVASVPEPDIAFTLNSSIVQQSGLFTGLPKGTYVVEAKRSSDANCHSDALVVELVDPVDCETSPLTLQIETIVAATCQSVSDGEAVVFASGGVLPYQYFVDGNEITTLPHFYGLSFGPHVASVKDASNTIVSLSFDISVLPVIEAQVFSTKTSCIESCDASLTLLCSGGSQNLDVQWDDGEQDLNRNNLCTGNYLFKVRDKRNASCFIVQTAEILSAPAIELGLQTTVQPSCPGSSDGELYTQVSGGSGFFEFEWNNGRTTKNLIGVGAGNYTFKVRDKILGCEVSKAFLISDPTPISVAIISVESPSCNGGKDGKIAIDVSNSNNPLIMWSNNQIGTSVNGVVSGTYRYTITGENGCSVTGQIEVPERPAVRATVALNEPSCFHSDDGEINLIVTGGVAPYYIEWSNGSRGTKAQDLSSGKYGYIITDRNDCSIASTAELSSPARIKVNAELTLPSCHGKSNGAISTEVSGGKGAYTYHWSNGQSQHSLLNIQKGKYTLTVADENLCTTVNSFVLSEPPLLKVDKQTVSNPKCAAASDGDISLVLSGGIEPYTYQWENNFTGINRSGLKEGSYSVKIIDHNNCELKKDFVLKAPAPLSIVNLQMTNPHCYGENNGRISADIIGGTAPYELIWSSGSRKNFAEALSAGQISLKVSDQNRCTLEHSFILTDPLQPSITGIPSEALICAGGKIYAQPLGEWTRYEWSDPNNIKSSTKSIEAKAAGQYRLQAWDNRGCSAVAKMEVIVTPNAVKADFLRISEAVLDQPIVFVDISVPIPAETKWLVPMDENVHILSQGENTIELLFKAPGDYRIGLRAITENCESVQQKIVSILEARKENSTGRDKEPEEEIQIVAYPNPMEEDLFIDISAPTRDLIELKLISNLDQRLIAAEQISGLKDYLVRWHIPYARAGVYTLIYRYRNSTFSKRLVVIR